MIFLAGNVGAVTVYSDWETGNQQETIDFEESIDFNVDTGSLNPPITLNVKLYDSNYNLVYTFENNKQIGSSSDSYTSLYETYTINQNIYPEAGNYKLIVSTEDNAGSAQSTTLNLKINPPEPENNPPEITSSPITEVDEDTSYEYHVKATDEDNDDLTYSLTQNPLDFSISSDGLISGTTPEVDYDKDFSVEVKVSDGEDYDTQSYTLTVKDVPEPNNPPVIDNIPDQTIILGESFESFDLDDYASDPDNDKLTFSYSGNQKIIVEIDENNEVTLTSPKSWTGKEDITFTVTDSHGESDSTTSRFTVTEPENNPPVIENIPDQDINEDASYEYQVKATDDDNDDLTYSLTQNPLDFSISSNGIISGMTPNVSQDTDYYVEVKVSDGEDYDTQSYTLTVKDVPDENTAPEVTINSPEQGETFDNKEISTEFEVQDQEDNLESCKYGLNNNENKSISCSEGTNTFDLDSNDLSEGENTLVIYATDTEGKTGLDSVSFNIDLYEDTTPPEITVVSPEQGETYYGKLKFLVYLNEPGEVDYKINNQDEKEMNNQGENTFTSEFLDLDKGNYEVIFYATDEAGNKANKTVEFEISVGEEGDGNTGVGDNDENDVCYKRIRGHCLTYEDYLYYKQHTNQNNIAINNTNTDDSEEKESFELKEFIKDNIWLIGLFIGLIFLTLLFILYLYQTDKLY